MNAFALFASELKGQAEQLEEYAQRQIRARGGDSNEDTDELESRARVLRDVANAADTVARLIPTSKQENVI